MRRYRMEWPERYATVSACHEALRRADDQFPEAPRIATMEDIVVGASRQRHRVELNVDLFEAHASRLTRKKRVAWPEYTGFMRRCGFEAHRDDQYGLPRVCVAPFDGAPLIRDCLGMTERGTDVARLCSAHIHRVVRWLMSSNRGFEVSDAFWRRNIACRGFYALSRPL